MKKRITSLCLIVVLLIISVNSTFAAVTPGTGKLTSQWGTFVNDIPNNIAITFTGDPKTTRTITWQTDSAVTSGEVVISDNHYPATSTVISGKTHHRVNLTGLTPGAAYTYVCGKDGAYSKAYSFTTESAADTFTILHVTDPQIGTSANVTDTQAWKRTIEAGLTEVPAPAFIVNTGDVVNNANETSLFHYFDYAQDIIASNSFVYSMGNNDTNAWYNRYFYTPANGHDANTYWFEYGNALFINIDSNVSITTALTTWLENLLKNTTMTWKVVMIHQGYYCRSGSNNAVTKLLDQYNVDLVLAGHNHFYCRSKPIDTAGKDKVGGTVYTIPNAAGTKYNGTSGQSYLAVDKQPNKQMFTKFTFSGDSIELNAYTVEANGTYGLYDTYTIKNASASTGATISGSVSPLVSDYANITELADFHNQFGKAKIELYKAADDSLVKTVYAEAKSGTSASFSIEGVANGSYYIVITRAGMGIIAQEVSISGGNVNLGAQIFIAGGKSNAEKATLNDVMECINIYLSKDNEYPSSNYKFYADTNGDGIINLTDCMNMMNAYLKK